MLIGLDHLGEVIARARKGDALLLEEAAGGGRGIVADLVEREFAVEVVVRVLNVDGVGGDERVVLGEGGRGGDEGDALEGGVDGGGVVDC